LKQVLRQITETPYVLQCLTYSVSTVSIIAVHVVGQTTLAL